MICTWSDIRKNLDRSFVALSLGLFVLGMLALVSASLGVRRNHPEYPVKQLVWGLIGVVAYLTVLKIGYVRLLKQSYKIYGFSLLALLFILIVGHTAKGAQSWIALGPLRFQPSELGKLALALVLARQCYVLPPVNIKNILSVLVVSGTSLVLIMGQPDLGSAMVYMAMTFVALWIGGTSSKYLGGMCALGFAALPIAWGSLKTYQKMRLMVFLDPTIDPQGAGYNVIQSRISVGSGGLFGKGFMEGTQSRLHFLPEPHTDFIFSVYAEEFGFIGGSIAIILFAMLFLQMLRIALRTRDMRAKILCSVIMAWFWVQVTESIAMSMGLAPITGLPLPLFSYGGSSLLAEAIGLGIVQSVAITSAQDRLI